MHRSCEFLKYSVLLISCVFCSWRSCGASRSSTAPGARATSRCASSASPVGSTVRASIDYRYAAALLSCSCSTSLPFSFVRRSDLRGEAARDRRHRLPILPRMQRRHRQDGGLQLYDLRLRHLLVSEHKPRPQVPFPPSKDSLSSDFSRCIVPRLTGSGCRPAPTAASTPASAAPRPAARAPSARWRRGKTHDWIT